MAAPEDDYMSDAFLQSILPPEEPSRTQQGGRAAAVTARRKGKLKQSVRIACQVSLSLPALKTTNGTIPKQMGWPESA